MANTENQPSTNEMSRNRRSSFTSATLSNLFPRSNSVSGGTPVFPGPIASAALNDQNRRRRLSMSTASALGLSGTSPISTGGGAGGGPSGLGLRRASMSTSSSASDAAVDESAIEEDDAAPRGSPNAPSARRTSFGAQAMLNLRGSGGSVGANANGRQLSSPGGRRQPQNRPRALSPTTSPSPSSLSSPFAPPAAVSPRSSSSFSFSVRPKGGFVAGLHSPRTASDKFPLFAARADQGYNWPEQFRSRAESSVVSGSRASFSFASGLGSSPPRSGGFAVIPSFGAGAGGGVSGGGIRQDRSKSVSDAETTAVPAARPTPSRPRQQQPRPKPDHFQERILKGDFYMD
ncbi:hypothetical protein CMQ_2005 [Grosmannia clavigera kw1407]|uniref:Uncharacterized protein n=1 Tax=Grosmannia clavigera (strain kw1407 / UAMH 11150) TaxID=655863 RepID=F0XMZ0_GROCL|nr:uncharacterized protein CMQ_2005 [Grosmannia clavigera kw1407]EFX00924.1 hypothetical protein CMQ_2005 [Grosmannia clavigera kw1407]